MTQKINDEKLALRKVPIKLKTFFQQTFEVFKGVYNKFHSDMQITIKQSSKYSFHSVLIQLESCKNLFSSIFVTEKFFKGFWNLWNVSSCSLFFPRRSAKVSFSHFCFKSLKGLAFRQSEPSLVFRQTKILVSPISLFTLSTHNLCVYES